MTAGRELTRNEKAAIRRFVIGNCADYDYEFGCIRLHSGCYMFNIGFTYSSLCSHFENALLPMSPEFQKLLGKEKGTKNCPVCGKRFQALRNQRYCSKRCAAKGRRIKVRNNVAAFREKQGRM